MKGGSDSTSSLATSQATLADLTVLKTAECLKESDLLQGLKGEKGLMEKTEGTGCIPLFKFNQTH